MTIERQRLIDKDIEQISYGILIELYRDRINELSDPSEYYNPSTEIIEEIKLLKETLSYVKKKKREEG